MHEVVRRIRATGAGAADGRYRPGKRLSAFVFAPYATAYAIWTGIGAEGTAILGMMILGDSTASMRVLRIALILAGVIGLKIFR